MPSVWLFQAVWTVFWTAIAVRFTAIIAVLGRLDGILGGCSRSFCLPFSLTNPNTATDTVAAVSEAVLIIKTMYTQKTSGYLSGGAAGFTAHLTEF